MKKKKSKEFDINDILKEARGGESLTTPPELKIKPSKVKL